MPLATESEMSPEEMDAFLSGRETGVLSFARDDESYAIPISFGYDPAEQTFYLRLVSTPESQKRSFLASSPSVRLVVYDEIEPMSLYRSVIARGTLTEISPAELSVDQIERFGESKRPLFEIWADSKRDLNIRLYQFTPAELTGRETEIQEE